MSDITFFHGPNSRSTGVLTLLEELQAPYELRLVNLKAGENRQPAYLSINPMGKVPAILDGDALVTEQVAIYIYLADRFPEAGLAPPIGDKLRGPYLRWIAFYGSSFEPAIVDRAQQRAPAPLAMSPYGNFDTTLDAVVAQVARGPWMLGERFTAADVLWGTALGWVTAFKLIPERAEILDYVARFGARPAVVAARAKDQALAQSQAAAG